MFKRIAPVLALAAALWTAALPAVPAHATDETSNFKIARARQTPGLPADRIEPIATPTGDDDMPNRTARPGSTIPQASSTAHVDAESSVHPSWYLALWHRILLFGSKVVFSVKA